MICRSKIRKPVRHSRSCEVLPQTELCAFKNVCPEHTSQRQLCILMAELSHVRKIETEASPTQHP
jgi:hypothetical protein